MKNRVVRILDALWQFCSFVFVPQRRQPRMDAGATEVWNSETGVLRILKMCE